MRFEKHAFNAWYEKHAFYNPLKSPMLTYFTHALRYFFSKRTFNTRSGKRMLYKRPILRTLLDVRKTCVNRCFIIMFDSRGL